MRDRNQAKDPYFDYAEVLLQIAIVTASISILSGSRPTFGFSLVLAVLGVLLSVNGFTLLVHLPFFQGTDRGRWRPDAAASPPLRASAASCDGTVRLVLRPLASLPPRRAVRPSAP